MTKQSQSLLTLLLTTSILACIAVYWSGIDGPFLLDDLANINQTVITESSYESWVQAAFSNNSGQLGRPVAAVSFAFTSLFHGLDPAAFKYHNLMIHLLIGVLLWPLGARILLHMPNPLPETRAWYIAGAAATLWLLHPLLASTTLYAVQRMTQLSTLFIIIALLAYIHFRPRLHVKPIIAGIGLALGTGIPWLLGLMSKENAALLPLYLLAIELTLFRWRAIGRDGTVTERKLTSDGPAWKRGRHVLLGYHAIFVFLPLSVGAIYVVVKWPELVGGYVNRNFTLTERLFTEAHAVWFYLKNILMPRAVSMSLFHDGYPIQTTLDVFTAFAITGHAALTVTAIALIRRAPVLSLGILIFYISHLLESTFIPLELVFEHRNYFAAWGLILALCYYITYPAKRLEQFRWVQSTVLIGLAAVFALMTHTRALTWANEELVYTSTLQLYPNSGRAITNLANIELRRGEVEAAREYLQKATRLSPNEAGPTLHLLFTYCRSDNYPNRLYEDTKARLQSGIVSAYTQTGIYSIGSLKSTGKCPALTADDIDDLLTAFLGNKRLNEKVKYYTLIQLGRIHLAEGDAEHARTLFESADALRDHVPYLHRLYAIEGAVFSSIKMDDMKSAYKSIDIIDGLLADPRLESSLDTKSILKTLGKTEDEAFKLQIQNNGSEYSNNLSTTGN